MTRPNVWDQFKLDGRVIIITGGAGLLGREYAHALAQAGAHVVVVDINGEGVTQVAASVTQKTGVRALGIQVDVSDKTAITTMVQRTIAEFDCIDGLVNNAAIDPKFEGERAKEHTTLFEEYPLELWNQSLAVNLTGMFLCTQAVAPAMLIRGRGSIVNISSIYGLVGPDQRLYERDDPQAPKLYKPVDYVVAKSAVMGLTRYLAAYWKDKGIRVNTLTLGAVFNQHEEEFVRRYSARTPLGRMADKFEYCGALLFLLSDASSYMTGSNLVVDGGWTAW